jgi:hypothetical protein
VTGIKRQSIHELCTQCRIGGEALSADVLEIVGLGVVLGVEGDGVKVAAEPTLVDAGAPAAARASLSAVSPNKPLTELAEEASWA